MEKPVQRLLQEDLRVINLGLEVFAHSLQEKEVEVVPVNWSPPAGGDQEMQELLRRLED